MLTYAEERNKAILKSKEFKEIHEKYDSDPEKYLSEFLPQGKIENGKFRVSCEGERGRRVVFDLDNNLWCDFADTEEFKGKGVISFLLYVIGAEVFLGIAKDFYINLPIFPAPECISPKQIENYANYKNLTVKYVWTYRDTDGGLLGYRVRLEDEKGNKQFATFTYRTEYKTKGGKQFKEGWRVTGGWYKIAPLYNMQEVYTKQDKPVLIVEGEKTCDAAKELLRDDFLVVCSGTGASALHKAFWNVLKDRDLTFWADNDEPGRNAVRKLASNVLSSLKMVDTSELKIPQKWDLADLGDWDIKNRKWSFPEEFPIEGIKTRSDIIKLIEKADQVPTELENLVGLSNEYVFVSGIDRFINRKNKIFRSPEGFDRRYMHIMEKPSKELLTDPDFLKVETCTYSPGQPQILEENGVLKFNTWEKFQVVPDETDPTFFIEHMKYLFPDKEVFNHVISFLACVFQNPGIKINHALLIQGIEGTGKSFLGELLHKIMGRNFSAIDAERISGRFTDWLENTQMIIVEEVMALGRREITNKLKTKITSEEIEIENKNQKPYKIPNRVNFIFFTNYKDSLVLDPSDRRFFVYNSPAKPRDAMYYDKLFDLIEENAGGVLTYLMEYDISKFNPKKPPMMTKDKQALIERSRPKHEIALETWIKAGRGVFANDSFLFATALEQAHTLNKSFCPFKVRDILESTGYQPVMVDGFEYYTNDDNKEVHLNNLEVLS